MANWKSVDGARLRQITCKADNIVGCGEDQIIYQRHTNDNFWKKFAPPVSAVWASAGVDHSIWSCNSNQEIYRLHPDTKAWDKVPGACVQIDAWAYDRAVYRNAQNELWEYRYGVSRKLTGNGTHITIGKDGEKWHINSNREIYRMLPEPPDRTKWEKIEGPKLKSIHCSDGNYVAGVSTEDGANMYRWNGGSNWTQLGGNGTHIGITWGNMWQVNYKNEVYRASISSIF